MLMVAQRAAHAAVEVVKIRLQWINDMISNSKISQANTIDRPNNLKQQSAILGQTDPSGLALPPLCTPKSPKLHQQVGTQKPADVSIKFAPKKNDVTCDNTTYRTLKNPPLAFILNALKEQDRLPSTLFSAPTAAARAALGAQHAEDRKAAIVFSGITTWSKRVNARRKTVFLMTDCIQESFEFVQHFSTAGGSPVRRQVGE
jgi:hypothetical protein